MLLAIDVGNTNTVAGVFNGDRLIVQWRIATDSRRMSDEYAALGASLFRLKGLHRADIDGVVLASVVPAAQSALVEAAREYLGCLPLLVTAQLDLGIKVVPHGTGADRIANAAAAAHRYGLPAIVVDFGTGTNFDVVDLQGAYIGGAIAPGLDIAMSALFQNTAQLPSVPLVAPPRAVGQSTVTALQSGIIYGYAGLVDGLVERITDELGGAVHVVATGGLAGIVAPHAKTVQHIDPDLTLFGLYLIFRSNRAHDSRPGVRQDQPLT
jgi:type III pantothenate kinase